MKKAWRSLLQDYQAKDPKARLLQKTEFPRMLKELVGMLKPSEHLPTAFEKCGLAPVNREKVLDRLPSIEHSQEIARNIDAVLLKKLEVRRFGELKKKQQRGKKVPAGQSYTHVEEEDSSSNSSTMEMEEEEDRDLQIGSDQEEDADKGEGEEEDRDKEDTGMSSEEELPDLPFVSRGAGGNKRRAGSYVAASYEGEWFIAEVCYDQRKVASDYTRLSYMTIKVSGSHVLSKMKLVLFVINKLTW